MTPTQAHVLLIAASAALFAGADWIAGRSTPLPGRSVWYATAGATIALALLWPPLAALGLAWGLYRGVLGWKSFGGNLDVHTPRQWLGLLARFVVSSVFPVAVIWGLRDLSEGHAWTWAGGEPVVAAFAVCLILSTFPNVWLGYEVTKGRDVDPAVDALHGALFGIAAAVSLLA